MKVEQQFLEAKVKKNDPKISGFFRRLTACQPSTDIVSCFMHKRKSRESYKSRNTGPYSNLFNTESNTYGFHGMNSNSSNTGFLSRANSVEDMKGNYSNDLVRQPAFMKKIVSV